MARPIDALQMLRRDHRDVLALMRRFEKTRAADEQDELRDAIVQALRVHTRIEEEVFYPYLLDATGREDLFQEADIEHGLAKDLVEQLAGEEPGSERIHAMVKVLAETVAHHVREEEEEIFPAVEQTGVDLKALGEALQECREETMGDGAIGNGHDGGARKQAHGGSKAHAGDGQGKGEARSRAGAKAHAEHEAGDDERYLHEHGDRLSASVRHAKWIHGPDDQPERDGQTLATRNLDVIRAWAQARGASPATTPDGDAERPRVLRFDFPGYDRELQPVSWEAWGDTFSSRDLVFLYQETLSSGRQSNFFRLDSPEREDG